MPHSGQGVFETNPRREYPHLTQCDPEAGRSFAATHAALSINAPAPLSISSGPPIRLQIIAALTAPRADPEKGPEAAANPASPTSPSTSEYPQ